MTIQERKRLTSATMSNPQPGDVFREAFSFWVRVVGREGDAVLTEEVSPACPCNKTKRYDTVEDFKRQFAYQSIDGYWVVYHGNSPTD